MIGWDDIYKVAVAMVPLYVSLILGYSSVKWWHMFNPDECNAINRLNCYFIIPLYVFEFTTHVNPLQMNFKFIGADIIAKAIILVVIALWANFTHKGNYPWSITTFSLCTSNNALVVGVPLMRAMYGVVGEDLVIQSSIIQSILWFMILLFMLELYGAKNEVRRSGEGKGLSDVADVISGEASSFLSLMKIVAIKLVKNPNTYACILGVIWSLISNRWNVHMPLIVEGSILIMSRAGSGIAMFCMGLFMALQEKIIACGAKLTLYGMFLRFIFGPFTVAIASFVVGLRGNVLRIAILQAALPQSVTSFVWAKEYELHADVLSTAVIFGTIMSLPLLIALYGLLNFIP